MKNRVVVTGMGAITPVGNDVNSFWKGIKEGKCGIDYITQINTEKLKVKVAGEVKDFKPEDFLDRKEAKRMDRYCQLALAAAKEAVEDSGLELENMNRERLGVVVGSGIGGLATIEKEVRNLVEKGPNRVSPLFIPMSISNMAAGNIAIKYGAKGMCTSVVTACATGTNAIGDSLRLLQYGMADVIIAGGAEASVTELAIAGFTNLTALSNSNDPMTASTPFDVNRSGFVMGEGAGILILETLEHAQKRGAKIYAELVGYGSTCDAHHMTAPAPDGEGGARAMKLAIENAGIEASEMSYVNAHGTSTPLNDKYETMAIKSVLGEYAYKVPVSSTKSMTGHLLGAAGAIEGVICVKALQDGFIPPTMGYTTPDPECDLDYVPNQGRKAELNYAMSNSLGFGGHNATIVFKRWTEV